MLRAYVCKDGLYIETAQVSCNIPLFLVVVVPVKGGGVLQGGHQKTKHLFIIHFTRLGDVQGGYNT